MSKSTKSQELQSIKEAIGKFPGGATSANIIQATGLTVSVRTISRRLEELIAQEEVSVKGSARATRYFLAEKSLFSAVNSSLPATVIPLSPESRKLLEDVTKPEQQRLPVTNHRKFLENYPLGYKMLSLSIPDRV